MARTAGLVLVSAAAGVAATLLTEVVLYLRAIRRIAERVLS